MEPQPKRQRIAFLHRENLEEVILDLGKYALFSVRVIGYFPFSVVTSKTKWKSLDIRIGSFSFLYTLLVSFVTIGCNLYIYHALRLLLPELRRHGLTMVAGSITFAYMSTYSTLLRISSFVQSKTGLSLWKDTIHLFQRLTKEYPTTTLRFDDAGKSSRTFVVWYLLGSLIQFVYVLGHIGSILVNTSFELLNLITIFQFMTLFGNAIFCLHVGFLVWVTFLMEIVVCSFETIDTDLENFIETKFNLHKMTNKSLSFVLGSTTPVMSISRVIEEQDMDNSDTAETKLQIANEIKSKVLRTMELFELIETHVNKLTEFFGFKLIVEILFIFLLCTLYSLIAIRDFLLVNFDILFFENVVTLAIPIFIFLSSLYNFCTVGSNISRISTQILKKMDKLINFDQINTEQYRAYDYVHLKVIARITRLADKPVAINAGYFATVNRPMIGKCIGAIAMNILVLLQN